MTLLRLLFLFLVLPGLAIVLSVTAKEARSSESLDIVLQMDKGSSLSFYLYSKSEGTTIYQENNSWGYGCRTLIAKDKATGKKHQILRQERNWKHNAPGTLVLNRQHGIETKFDLCDGSWYALPKLPAKATVQVELSPVYEIKKKEAALGKTWYGKVVGRAIDYSINCPEKLNQY